MQFFKKRRPKIIFIAILVSLTIAILVYLPVHNKNHEIGNLQPESDIGNKPHDSYDNFTVDRISIVKHEDHRIVFSLFADKVIHRKRASKLFVYQNLKELYMSGVKIDIYHYNSASTGKEKKVVIPVDDIGSVRMSLGKPTTTMEEYLAGNTDIDLDLLTRILVADLSINIYLPYNKKVSITSKSGRVDANFENIIFGGLVKVTASDGKELYAPQAIWSKKFNGMYFPEGYTIRNNYQRGKAFFTLNREGKFLWVSRISEIDYTDPIEEKETALYTDLFKKMPAHLRFMFGIGIPQN